MQVLRDKDPDDLPKVRILLQLPLETGMGRQGSMAGSGILVSRSIITLVGILKCQRVTEALGLDAALLVAPL